MPGSTSLLTAIAQSSGQELQTCLRNFARELTSEVSRAAPERSDEILSTLIAELALSAADHRRLMERRRKQAEAIAAAQARGVRFGRPSPPLPDNFDKSCQAFQEGKMTLQEAAKACGMRKTTFETAVARKGQSASPETML